MQTKRTYFAEHVRSVITATFEAVVIAGALCFFGYLLIK